MSTTIGFLVLASFLMTGLGFWMRVRAGMPLSSDYQGILLWRRRIDMAFHFSRAGLALAGLSLLLAIWQVIGGGA